MFNTILEVLKYSIPSLVVFLVTYIILKSFFRKELDLLKLQLRMDNRKQVLPLKLQAYERMAIFLERISLNSLVSRLRIQRSSATDLQLEIISAIKTEFEHNIAQQIYISEECWDAIILCKDEMIKVVNLVSASLPSQATSDDLGRALFDYLLKSERVQPTQRALDTLKTEVRTML